MGRITVRRPVLRVDGDTARESFDTLVVEHANTTGTLPFGDQNAEWQSSEAAGTNR